MKLLNKYSITNVYPMEKSFSTTHNDNIRSLWKPLHWVTHGSRSMFLFEGTSNSHCNFSTWKSTQINLEIIYDANTSGGPKEWSCALAFSTMLERWDERELLILNLTRGKCLYDPVCATQVITCRFLSSFNSWTSNHNSQTFSVPLTESCPWQRSDFSLGWPAELPSASHLRFGLKVTALQREHIV